MTKGLKGFVKARDSREEANLVAREIRTSSPRAAALVAGAFLDDFVQKLILRHLVQLTSPEVELLFEPDRPLGSFSAKIRLGGALGIYGPKTAHDLNIMRDIRNAFAHGLRRMNFETPEVKHLLAAFYCLHDIPNCKDLSPRKLFFEITAMLVTHLYQKIVSSPSKRQAPKLTVFCPHLD